MDFAHRCHSLVGEDFFYYLTNKFDGKYITTLLLQLKGPIRRFAFSIEPKTLCGQVGLNKRFGIGFCFFLGKELRS